MTTRELERMMPGAHWARTRKRIKRERLETMAMVNSQGVAEYFGTCEQNVRRLARRGDIPSMLMGGQYRFDLEECREYFAQKAVRRAVEMTGDVGLVDGVCEGRR